MKTKTKHLNECLVSQPFPSSCLCGLLCCGNSFTGIDFMVIIIIAIIIIIISIVIICAVQR